MNYHGLTYNQATPCIYVAHSLSIFIQELQICMNVLTIVHSMQVHNMYHVCTPRNASMWDTYVY